jgi:hypothetical protein
MILCDSPVLERWSPPPQENLTRPTWTRLLVNGRILCNSLEEVRWGVQPVELMICEACWQPGCSPGNVARVVAFDEQLVFMRPAWESIDLNGWGFIGPQHLLPEAVLMPRSVWDGLCQRFPGLPPFEAWPRAVGQDLAALWLAEMPEAVRAQDLVELARQLRLVLASDPAALETAVDTMRGLARWVAENPANPVAGRIVRMGGETGPLNTLYFDGPGFPEWQGFILGRAHAFAFGKEWWFQENSLAPA